MSRERRKHPRFQFRGTAQLKFESWSIFKVVYTVNISKGGISLELDRAPPVGSLLQVRLVLPDGWPLDIDSAVRHVTTLPPVYEDGKMVERCVVGVEFQNLDDEKRALIEATIAKHAK